MSFYKEILPFVEYVHSIRKLESYLSFDMKFPTKWAMPKSIIEEGQIIGFEVDNVNLKGVTFVSSVDENGISSVLSKIGKIIKVNKDRELKEKLFKQTVEQLKQTFEKNDLDKLQKLYFDFDNHAVETELNGEIYNEQDRQERTIDELV